MTTNQDVAVDVIIPAHNAQAYLRETIESAIRQTMPRFRLLIIDNNSSDGTPEIIRSFDDIRIESVSHSQTLGLFQNLNSCLAAVRAPYFCILHADDRLKPTYLAEMLRALERTPSATLASCQVEIIDYQGRKSSNLNYSVKNLLKSRSWLNSAGTIQNGSFLAAILRSYNFMVTPSIMYRREIIERIGEFRTDLDFWGDHDYYMRALSRGAEFVLIPTILFEYRIHKSQMTNSLTKSQRRYLETLSYLSEGVDRANLKDSVRARETVEARVALAVIWDYITANGDASRAFRSELIEFLLKTPILSRLAPAWRMLRQTSNLGRVPRATVGTLVGLGLITPFLLWRLARS